MVTRRNLECLCRTFGRTRTAVARLDPSCCRWFAVPFAKLMSWAGLGSNDGLASRLLCSPRLAAALPSVQFRGSPLSRASASPSRASLCLGSRLISSTAKVSRLKPGASASCSSCGRLAAGLFIVLIAWFLDDWHRAHLVRLMP